MADAQAMTIPEQAIEAAARALCRFGTSFSTIEATNSWVDEKWSRFKEEATIALTAAAPHMSVSAREQALEEAAQWYEKQRQKWLGMNIGLPDFAPEIRALKPQQNTETSVIEKKKFYHNEWPHDALMAARRDGFIDHNGGEAWRYQFTHKDEKGKYDLLYRDTSNSSIQAELPPSPQTGGEADAD